MESHYDVVIVGGGHAGAQAAIMLRQLKFDGSIAIVGEEAELPYERPPLSKEYFAGEKPFERLLLRPAAFWSDRDVAMLTGRRVVTVDPERHVVETAGGEAIGYRKLVWATGGTPRSLACSGHALRGVHTVRTRADTDRILDGLHAVERAVVIGGGYIGLEAAAGLRKKGKPVTLVEALPRVLARVAGEPLSRFYEAEHRAQGVDVRLGAVVECVEERDGAACGVRLGDGTVIPAGLVIVGIGILPEVAPLRDAGAAGGNGVDVDEYCRTSLPDVYAVGDCAAQVSAFAGGERVRVESVQNANDQAATAARDIVGQPQAHGATPWFWSNQYDLRLQTVGLSQGHDRAVLRGSTQARSFSLVYLKEGRVVALDCVNATRDYVQGRKLVESGARPDVDRLAQGDVALKDLVDADVPSVP